MKLIFIMSDTFRRDHIGAYGNKRIHTPNLDRLAAMSYVFDHCYVGSFPTLPNRRDIHLGVAHKGERFNKWRGIEDDEVTLAQRLREKRIHSMMINDTANSVTNGKNFFKGFSCYEAIRGQEGDNMWSDLSVPLEFPVPPHLIRYNAERWHQVLVNRSRRRVEDDYFAPGTFKRACEWLERNRARDSFLLWVETFDPHEPWDPPQHYIDLYDPGYTGRVFESPTYGLYRKMGITDREVRHIHARYCGECTMVDTAVGRLMRTLETLNLIDDVAIIFTSDHGTHMGLEGDDGRICKPHRWGADGMVMPAGRPIKQPVEDRPMLTGTMRIPLFIHLPKQSRPKRFSQIVQPWDLTPTVLEMAGLKPPPEFIGQSLMPLIRSGRMKPRPFAFNGADGPLRQAMNKDYIYAWWGNGGRAPWLVDLRNDRSQSRNLAGKHPEVCAAMHKALSAFDPLVPPKP